jgi:hypothetical protein
LRRCRTFRERPDRAAFGCAWEVEGLEKPGAIDGKLIRLSPTAKPILYY